MVSVLCSIVWWRLNYGGEQQFTYATFWISQCSRKFSFEFRKFWIEAGTSTAKKWCVICRTLIVDDAGAVSTAAVLPCDHKVLWPHALVFFDVSASSGPYHLRATAPLFVSSLSCRCTQGVYRPRAWPTPPWWGVEQVGRFHTCPRHVVLCRKD